MSPDGVIHSVKLSILDLIHRVSGQASADALTATTTLAVRADELGFNRFWVAEHHNSQSVASTVPAVILSHIGALTKRIRLGSGGVMVPNHPALSVSEQFALLESMYPGRIDLGIGRAPGTDPVTSYLLRNGHTSDDVQGQFPSEVASIAALLGVPTGPASVGETPQYPPVAHANINGRDFEIRATPMLTSSPQIWLLGSSDYSAKLAAALGLPYVFANHFGIPGLQQMVDIYKEQFSPSGTLDAPLTFVPASVVIGKDDADAKRRALPYIYGMAMLRSGQPQPAFGRVEDIDEILAGELPDRVRENIAAISNRMIAGSPATVAARLRELAESVAADEVMIAPVAGFYRDEDPTANQIRLWGADAIAKEFGLQPLS